MIQIFENRISIIFIVVIEKGEGENLKRDTPKNKQTCWKIEGKEVY